jgi:hypothetical protein
MFFALMAPFYKHLVNIVEIWLEMNIRVLILLWLSHP